MVALPAQTLAGTRSLPEQPRVVSPYLQNPNPAGNPVMHHSMNNQSMGGVPAGNIDSLRTILLSSQQHVQGSRLQNSNRVLPPFPVLVDTSCAIPMASSDTRPELPSEQNWQPTGRMRGSLTGNAYSAALNQYLVPPSQSGQSRPPGPNAPGFRH